MGPAGRAAAALPGGHVEGFADTFARPLPGGLRGYRGRPAVGPARLPDLRRRARRDARQRRDRRERPPRSLGRRRARAGRPRDAGRGGRTPMRLGLLTAPFPETPLDRGRRLDGRQRLREHRDRVLAAGRRPDPPLCRHLAHRRGQPVGERRRRELVDEIGAKGLTISGLGYYPNPLHPDPEHRAEVIGHLKPRDHRGRGDGRPATSTRSWAPTRLEDQDANWAEAQRVWPDIVGFAQDHGRKITIENCPMLFSSDEWPGGHNLATTPRIWRRILEALGRHDRAQLRPVAPDPPDDRHPALHPRVRAAHPPRPGQGPDDRPRGPVRARRLLERHRLAGPAPARPRRRRLEGRSSPRSIGPATTAT